MDMQNNDVNYVFTISKAIGSNTGDLINSSFLENGADSCHIRSE